MGEFSSVPYHGEMEGGHAWGKTDENRDEESREGEKMTQGTSRYQNETYSRRRGKGGRGLVQAQTL